MSSNMLNLLNNMYENNGLIVNNLIKAKVITKNEVIEEAINSNNPYIIYSVARYVKGLSKKSINLLAEKLIELKSIKYVYDFANNIKRAPIDILEDFTIEYGSAENIYNFAKDVDGVLVDKFANAIIEKGNEEFIYKFAINIDEAPVLLLVEALVKLNDGYFLLKIAKSTKDDTVKNKILNIILNEMNNAKYVYNYTKEIEDAPIDKLADIIIKLGNEEYIYKFARDIKGAPIDKLAVAIIKINNPEYIFYFAKDVNGAPIDKLADAIITSGNTTYMELFVHIDNAPKEKIKIAINRIIVSAMSDEEKMAYLFELAKNNDIQLIEYSSDIYRKMFIDDSSIKVRKRTK